MKHSRKMLRDLFEPGSDVTAEEIRRWWRDRRLRYNLFVAVGAVICFSIHAALLFASGHLGPGEDLVEPLAIPMWLVVGSLAVNACYSLGPSVECALLRAGRHSEKTGPLLLKLGLTFSAVVVFSPVLAWGVIWVFRIPVR